MFVITTVDNNVIAISKAVVGTVEPTASGGCKITTTLVNYSASYPQNVVYYIKEPIQYVIGAMRK